MRKQILKHIMVVRNMESANIPYAFVYEFGEERCKQVSDDVLAYGLSEITKKMGDGTKKYLMGDQGMFPYLKQMYTDISDYQMKRLESLFCQAGEVKLSEFNIRDIKEVYMDEKIPVGVQFNYLKYFKNQNLSETDRFQVLESLEKYRNRIEIDIAQLTPGERDILLSPIFTSDLMEYLWNNRDTWRVYVRPGVSQVLQKIHEIAYPYQILDNTQFRQIAENPDEIRLLLENVLTYFSEEQGPEFLEIWLENESLLSDLRRLVNLIPDMDEIQKKQILSSRVAYVCSLYQAELDNINMEELRNPQQEVLLYSIVSGKKHFLTLVNENSEAFLSLPNSSILLDPDIYESRLNLNTLNERNLRDAYSVSRIQRKCMEFLRRQSYTFDELKVLSPLGVIYFQLYGLLTNARSDDRLRILRELVNCDCLPYMAEEEELKMLANRLSEKPLSVWMDRELGHIKDLKEYTCIQLLKDWDSYQKYIPEIRNERQVICLMRNRESLTKYETFTQFQENMLVEDTVWLWLKEKLSFTDDFIALYEERIRQFVYDGEAEIVYQFCMGAESKLEEVRRLLAAELMGEFQKLKYHEKDLENEIAYPISEKTETSWKENLEREVERCRIWEEDRFIPVLQIGEIPKHTCISYCNGIYKECLLSCFDSNKKVLYAEVNGRIVFRALIRLTKGSWSSSPIPAKKVEFVDLTKEDNEVMKKKEELVLFLERPYFSRINRTQENNVVSVVFQMVHEKAKKLHARVVISQDYDKFEASKEYDSRDYYVYISASKNGSQYLDSLCGEATVSQSGTYGKNKFLLKEKKKEKSAA